MMIAVSNMSKVYGRTKALDDLSFTVSKGHIVGLLGNNGAGKSTTMRILASLAAPSDGTATIAGFDVVWDSLEVRRKIGYLPETVPLCGDMRVGEYLRFRAGLKGVAVLQRRERVRQVMRLCGLLGMERRVIGTLSKGYRKRVGLADALVHEPDVLLLDEPTLGIDPAHAREIQHALAALAGRHTILFSTHSPAEAEGLCQQILVLERGRLASAEIRAENLSRAALRPVCVAELRGPRELIHARLRAIPHVAEVTHAGDGTWNVFTLELEPGHDVRADVFAISSENHWVLRELRLESGAPGTGSPAAANERTVP